MNNVVELHPHLLDAMATGNDIAVTVFVDIEHENKPRLEAARLAAESLLSDIEINRKQEKIEELTAFIDQLLMMYDTSTVKKHTASGFT